MKIPRGFDFGRTYYIAGPMSGYPEFNYPAFGNAKAELEAEAIKVVSPHTIPWPDQPIEGEELWQVMMREALQLLLGCNGMILLKGWAGSKGALLEHQIAASLKMPLYFLDNKYLVSMHDEASPKGALLS